MEQAVSKIAVGWRLPWAQWLVWRCVSKVSPWPMADMQERRRAQRLALPRRRVSEMAVSHAGVIRSQTRGGNWCSSNIHLVVRFASTREKMRFVGLDADLGLGSCIISPSANFIFLVSHFPFYFVTPPVDSTQHWLTPQH